MIGRVDADADAGVAHDQHRLTVLIGQRDVDPPAGRGELQRVA